MENVTTNLLSTVQVYNLHDIPNVIQFWKDNGSNNNLIMNFVNWPSEFKIDILPQEYKEQIASEIEKVAFDIPQQQLDTFRINAMLAQLREHTEITDDILDSRQRFVKRTRAYDILRKQDINLVSNNLGNLVSEWEEDGRR
jgi:hypothetical protein